MKLITATAFIIAAVLTCFTALPAGAAGLGALQVQSTLGQPFQAEIGVNGLTADDLLTAQTRLGTQEEYEAARLNFLPALRQIRVALEKRADGKPYLRITSHSPINEPALDLLVEVSWRGGRLQQRYAVLLDPAR